MAATITQVNRYAVGDQTRVVSDVVCDGSYPAGGYPITPAQLGFTLAEGITVDVQKLPSGSDAAYDLANQKLKIFSGGSTEAGAAAAGVTANGVTYRVTVTGKYAN